MNDRLLVLCYTNYFGSPAPAQNLACPDGWILTFDRHALRDADLVLFHMPDFRPSTRLAKFPGQLWAAWSQESAQNYPFQDDPAIAHAFDLTVSHHQGADVFFGYLPHLAAFTEAIARPLTQHRESAPAVMFQSSGANHSGRDALSRELMKFIRIDSYGRAMNNRGLADDRGWETKLTTIARYKFTLAFENAIERDYVTEKFFQPLMAGSVPVYLGAPNVAEFAPGAHAYVDASGFASPASLAGYLLHLAHDDVAYGAYHAWRGRPLSERFVRLSESTQAPFLDRLGAIARRRLVARPRRAGAPYYPFARWFDPRAWVGRRQRG